MNAELHLRIAGAMQIALALLHLDFGRRFHWREELARVSLLNRQMFYVHTFFLCVVLALIGSLSLFAPAALLEPSRLARLVLGGNRRVLGAAALLPMVRLRPESVARPHVPHRHARRVHAGVDLLRGGLRDRRGDGRLKRERRASE